MRDGHVLSDKRQTPLDAATAPMPIEEIQGAP
jgi:hypothetical protein